MARRWHARDYTILRIEARRALEAGVGFYCGNDDIWMADAIPPAFIVRAD